VALTPGTRIGPYVRHTTLCNTLWMATNLALDDKLLDEALKIGGKATKKETVTEALQYIGRLKQARIVDLFGTIDYDPNYDYKKQRRRWS
jgi:hypothetical protein